MRKSTVNPFYLSTPTGRCFVVHFSPNNEDVKRQESILVIPPFAEELNNSRRMITEQARMLAASGFDVFCLDLWGTGDSDGEFVDASWDIWLQNLRQAYTYLKATSSTIHFLTIRTGNLLAIDLLSKYSIGITNLIMWQPIVNGKLFVKQLLRIRIASQAFKGIKETSEGLLNELQNKGLIEIAGYEFNSELIQSLSGHKLSLNNLDIKSLHVIEIGNSSSMEISSLVGKQTKVFTSECIKGSQYWANIEASISNELLLTTTECMSLA